jgi:hypothetical protein
MNCVMQKITLKFISRYYSSIPDDWDGVPAWYAVKPKVLEGTMNARRSEFIYSFESQKWVMHLKLGVLCCGNQTQFHHV